MAKESWMNTPAQGASERQACRTSHLIHKNISNQELHQGRAASPSFTQQWGCSPRRTTRPGKGQKSVLLYRQDKAGKSMPPCLEDVGQARSSVLQCPLMAPWQLQGWGHPTGSHQDFRPRQWSQHLSQKVSHARNFRLLNFTPCL